MLDEIVPPLEAHRHKLKELTLKAKDALIDAGVPTLQKNDTEIPFFYGCNSWASRATVPWNRSEKRVMWPSEGIQWLSKLLEEERAKVKELTKALREVSK